MFDYLEDKDHFFFNKSVTYRVLTEECHRDNEFGVSGPECYPDRQSVTIQSRDTCRGNFCFTYKNYVVTFVFVHEMSWNRLYRRGICYLQWEGTFLSYYYTPHVTNWALVNESGNFFYVYMVMSVFHIYDDYLHVGNSSSTNSFIVDDVRNL